MITEISSAKPQYRRPVGLIAIAVSWAVVLAILVVWLYWDRLAKASGVGVYLLLWIFLAVWCWLFSRKLSMSGRIGRPRDVFEVPTYLSITSLGLIGIFGVAPYFDPIRLAVQLPSVSYLPMGLLLTGLGLVSLWVGYGLVSLAWKPPSHAAAAPAGGLFDFRAPSLRRTIVFYLVLAVLRLGLLFAGGGEQINATLEFGAWKQWLGYLLELRWVFMPLVFLQVAGRKWPWYLLVPVLGFESAMAIVSGWSSSLLVIAILFFGCLAYYRRRIPIFAWLVGAVLLASLVPIARFTRTSSSRALPTLVTYAVSGAEEFWLGGDQSAWTFSWDLLVNRQSIIAQTPAIIMQMTPGAVPYRPLEEIAAIPFSFVPRVLWSSKPAYADMGAYVTEAYFGLDPRLGSAAPTMAGSAFMYGGWLPVIAAMFFLGVVSAALYGWFALPALLHDQIGFLAVYLGALITNFHIGEGDIIGVWQGIVQRFIVYSLFMLLLCVATSRRKRGAQPSNIERVAGLPGRLEKT